MSSSRAFALIKQAPKRAAIRIAVVVWHCYHWLPIGAAVAAFVRLVEWLLSIVPFVICLWAGAFCRSIVVGWRLSGAPSEEKRKALREMFGRDETLSP